MILTIKIQSTKAHLRSLENAGTAEPAGDPLQEGAGWILKKVQALTLSLVFARQTSDVLGTTNHSVHHKD